MVLAFGFCLYKLGVDYDTGNVLSFGPRLHEAAIHSDIGMTLLLRALGYTPVDSYDSGMALPGHMYCAPVDSSDSGEYTLVDIGFGIVLAVLVVGNGALWCWYKTEDPDFGFVLVFGAL
jgi:hypothetical protein